MTRSVSLRRSARTSLPLLVGCLGVLCGIAHCFSPSLPTCSYRCGPADSPCPAEYECRVDGYCHLRGSTEACSYRMDLAVPDLVSTPDLAASKDQ